MIMSKIFLLVVARSFIEMKILRMSLVAVVFPQEVPQKMKGRIIKWKRKIERNVEL